MTILKRSIDCNETHTAQKPSHTWLDHLMDSVHVVSQLQGRVRFHIDFVADEMLGDAIRRQLSKLAGATLSRYSSATRTALIHFDPKLTTVLDVATMVLLGVREYGKLHGECDLDHHHHSRSTHGEQAHGHDHGHGDDCDHEHDADAGTDAAIRRGVMSVAATGVALGTFLYKRVAGKPPLLSNFPVDLASLITIASGYPIFRAGLKSVQKKKATDDTLISVAVIASLFMRESITGLSVVWLIQLGRLLETITLKRSRTALKEFMDITPPEAWVVTKTDSSKDISPVRKVGVDFVKLDETIRVFHGEKVPLDGTIISGSALMTESFLTGEPIPKQKKAGDKVFAGSVVTSGEIDVRVTSLVHETVVATMIDAIENLRDKKAPIEKVGNRFAKKFVPISIAMAAGTYLVTRDARRAITMLVIACPCAAGLATPTAVSASIGKAAKKGILIKGGSHLEMAARVDTVVFDKTGTLTEGHPKLHKTLLTDVGRKLGAEESLRLAASAEQFTVHPLGRVLVEEAKKAPKALTEPKDYEVLEGLGIRAKVGKKDVLVGSRRLLDKFEISVPEGTAMEVTEATAGAESAIYASVNGELAAVFLVEDVMRASAPAMIAKLRQQGIRRLVLATGDQDRVAKKIAAQVGIDEVHSEMLPDDKLELVRELRQTGRKVAMIGDGINDAQALTEADLSVAIGASRCDVAIESADVTIARDDLMLVPELLGISKKTLSTIYQNFGAAVGINAIGTAIGAMGRLSPFAAAIVHNLSTIAVVMNSFRLGRQVSGPVVQ